MNLIEEQVQHSRFGLGTILSQTDSTVEVRFGAAFGVKKFLYPAAFESFLVPCSPALKESIDKEISQVCEQMEAARKRQIEAEKIREEAARELVAQRTAAKKAPRPRMVKPKKTAEATT